MQVISVLGTGILTAVLFIPVLYLTEKADTLKTKWDNMESIEASVAWKREKKQPEKPTSQPDIKKPDGVSHDEKKPVTGCKLDSDCHTDELCKNGKCVAKSDKPAKAADPKDPFKGISRPDDDNEPGKPTTKPGDFNGDQFGFAPVTRGDPYWQKLALDIHQAWEIPSISDVKGAPAGCFHLTPDGKIADVRFKEKSGNDVLDDSVQRALDTVKKSRNDNPIQVPTELLGATTGWICFRFDPNKS